MIYNVTFDICAGIISIFSLYIIISKKGLQKESNKLLLFVIIATLVSAVFDIWSSVGNSYIAQYTYVTRDVLNYIFLFVHTSTSCLFAWYIITLLGLNHRIKKLWVVLFLLPEFIAIFLPLALNPIFRWVFYYDANGVYSHGVMMYALYAAGYLYMLFTVYLSVRFRNLLLKSQRYAAIMLLVFSIIPIFVQQIFMPHQLLELFFQSIGIFGFLTTVENSNAVYNPVTKIYNRAVFLRDIDLAVQNRISKNVIIVKLSRAKYFEIASLDVNYANGVIGSAAEWLNGLSKKIDAYDCERGHFVLAIFCDRDCDIKALEKKIYAKFSGRWQYQNKSTELPVQICIANIPKEVQSVEHVMHLVDLSYIDHEAQTEIISLEKLESMRLGETVDSSGQHQFASEILGMLDDFIAGVMTLTPAERNILRYYIDGHEIAEIPKLAFISINTVRKHNKNIYRKLSVGTKEELLLYIDLLRRSNRLQELSVPETEIVEEA
ncbi:MAG: LuxR C-terminal-related transcriptional regulator [Christensenella sp.]|nr:LuxR C-terminal-related transcriptional regulator [Christensenella sp.]